jgi:YesN/AraC family two-component response regulator
MNASSLSAKFKKETGCTLTDYINQRRVNASLILLVTTKLPVGEVAEKVGYINRNYYSRIFKKIEGMTPKEYRESMRGENEDIE